MIYDDGAMAYKKRARRKSVVKADHKHDYQPCVFEYEKIDYYKVHGHEADLDTSIGTYCPICGKIGSVNDFERWMVYTPTHNGKCFHYEYTIEANAEITPETRTLPTFFLNDMLRQKFVSIENSDDS